MFELLEPELHEHMEKAVKVLTQEFSKLRTGRATPALLDTVRVDYYGNSTPLHQMANISAPDARLLVIQPWDQNTLGEIERAIQKSELGVTPQNDGKIIRIPIPPLTEERRKEFVKLLQKHAEECRVAIRNIRRNGMEELKKAEKAKEITEDDFKRDQEKIQKLTDEWIGKVDALADKKSKEVLEI